MTNDKADVPARGPASGHSGAPANEPDLQLASGYAHEMRNALSGAQFCLAALFPVELQHTGRTMHETVARTVTSMESELLLLPHGESRDKLLEFVGQMRASQELAGQMFENLFANIDRGMGLTQEMLSFARAGHLVAEDERVSAATVVRGLLREFDRDFAQRGIVAEASVPADLCLPMKEEHAYAIVRNLLANARDALSGRGADETRHIVVRGELHASFAEVTVSDTGMGMSAATQAKLFRPFFTTKGSDGTGLGLGLSRRLAQLYGGKLSFQSQESVGTTFSLTMPVAASK